MEIKNKLVTGLAAIMTLLATNAVYAGPVENKKLVEKAMTVLFIKKDVSAVDKYWSKSYIQHNPTIPNGRESLPGLVKSLPANSTYEIGKIVADGDFVMIHGRYTGLGPKPQVAVDIFRVKDGKLAEHWDVLQEDVPASETKSGNPMFEPGK